MEQTEEKKEAIDLKNLSGGLEILVQLSEKGEIDPWDIDIIDVTNKYLAALDSTSRENLLNAGRAIFFASVLLRLKSEILLNISNETLLASQQTDNFFPEDELLDQDGVHLDLSKLEGFLIRSSIGKQQRKRSISLSDLIFALQQAEEEEERRALRAKLKAQSAFTLAPFDTPTDILEIAHEEDIKEIVEKIEAIIQEHLTNEKPITLSFLTEILNNKVKPFLALLFLANSQKVVLEQNEIYKEVYIHKGGTVIQEKEEQQRDGKTVKEQDGKVRARRGVPQQKKNIIDKIKDKITGNKSIEVTSEGNEIVDIKVKTQGESEVINDGNNTTTGA